MNLVMFGPPGSGKGTQATRLAKELGVPHISTGDILREAVARGTELGKKARSFMERGELVPDWLVINLVGEALANVRPRNGFLLDGFPRTMAQARALERMLADEGKGLDAVLSMNVPDEVLIARISGRRICLACGANYHVQQMPPRKAGVCDRCGGELSQRPDDSPAAVAERLRVFRNETAGVADFYRAKGILREISGDQPIESVALEIRAALESVRQASRVAPRS